MINNVCCVPVSLSFYLFFLMCMCIVIKVMTSDFILIVKVAQ